MTNRSRFRPLRHARTCVLLMTFLAAGGCCAIAQVNAPSQPLGQQIATPTGASASDGSPSFDVVSIKPNNTGKRGNMGLRNDTYMADGHYLWEIVYDAYLSPTVRQAIQHIDGFPSWAESEQYDIAAKVDANTAVRLQSATLREKKAILQPMLQKMLVDRCGLIVHRVPVEVQGYALVLARKGPKLAQSRPSDVVPQGFKDMGEGGKARMVGIRGSLPEIDYFNVSTAALVEQLSTMRNLLIVDQTGLKGTYNFSLYPLDDSPTVGDESAQRDPRLGNTVPWDLGRLGLQLNPIRGKAESIAIDSIHRPTPN